MPEELHLPSSRELELIRKFAPIVYLDKRESWFPMDPVDFIKKSRFRHHRNKAKDQGWNKITVQWVTGDLEDDAYYDVPVSLIAQFAAHPNGKNRRPRDENAGRDYDVFLETRTELPGVSKPNGKVPCFFRKFVPKAGVHRLQYWFFFGYNFTGTKLNHQGDWERLNLIVSGGKIREVIFRRHGNDPVIISPRDLEFEDGRPVVFSARGTHALYPSPGTFPTVITHQDIASRGYRWDTSRKLESLYTQVWRPYAGAWGKVGKLSELGFMLTTGPLGPWYKRDD